MRRYCFPYKKELSRMFGEADRPVVDVYLNTKSGDWFQVSPYADSGSDITLFPGSVCEILGLNLDEGDESTITGISGEEIKIFIHNIKIKIGEEEMDIRAGFCVREDIPYLLGRTDILSHFDICFESDKICFIVK
ncbi:hypothetical protein CW713_07165 [Methanophagales archaeon]|nr:MAG: hypothetical protein CW714_01330 [Methanophagales archaeon]RJS80800.1 MAG: hypothetical protein CW713_07165 [Methanophagales archaeon]